MIKKMKKSDIFKMIFALVSLFLIFGIVFYFYGTLQRKEEPVNVSKVESDIVKYGYYINDNASNYYKDEFAKLKNILESDERDDNLYITQLAKVFVIDLLSLNNKINKYEVTSSQYFNSTKREMYTNKVVGDFYDYIEDNSYNDRKQSLPEVSDVIMNELKTTTYKMGEESVPAYEITAEVSYVSDLGYDKLVDVILTKEDNKYSVVSYKPGESKDKKVEE